MSLRDDLNRFFADYLPQGSERRLDEWAQALANYPCRNTTAVVGLSTVLFYLAERGRNPKVNDIWDALVYCSTCISVGYSDIFAKTPVGKILGSALMTVGPAMAAKTLNGPDSDREERTQGQILDTLRQILVRLEEGAMVEGEPRRGAG